VKRGGLITWEGIENPIVMLLVALAVAVIAPAVIVYHCYLNVAEGVEFY